MNSLRTTIIATAVAIATLPRLQAQPLGPPPPNDLCGRAMPIRSGQYITGLENITATKGLDYETPAIAPATCIQTVENDMWFTFNTESGKEWYEVTIVTQSCNTPAGLQALLIRTDDCNATHFQYRGCSNKINTDTIKLFLHEPQPDIRHLIWIDGYDGTLCEFQVSLDARGPLTPADYRYLRYDYQVQPEPHLDLDGFTSAFENNAAIMRWKSPGLEDAAFYIIEQIPNLDRDQATSPYTRVVGILDAQALVGAGQATYEFQDLITDYRGAQRVEYRVVRVAPDGTRTVSEQFSIPVSLTTSFYAAEVKPSNQPNIYTVHYVNHKKGQTFQLQVLDQSGQQVKHMTLPKEPQRDGDITLKMEAFPAGTYTFTMSNGKEAFRRTFIHIPQ